MAKKAQRKTASPRRKKTAIEALQDLAIQMGERSLGGVAAVVSLRGDDGKEYMRILHLPSMSESDARAMLLEAYRNGFTSDEDEDMDAG
ncbi:MAG: hypothetical protein B7733_12990 [Myxococcales bacterium FL481]|nr:MAG: hypothetical protein B7733_12990 [Myxococcales bacterium FL481]